MTFNAVMLENFREFQNLVTPNQPTAYALFCFLLLSIQCPSDNTTHKPKTKNQKPKTKNIYRLGTGVAPTFPERTARSRENGKKPTDAMVLLLTVVVIVVVVVVVVVVAAVLVLVLVVVTTPIVEDRVHGGSSLSASHQRRRSATSLSLSRSKCSCSQAACAASAFRSLTK